MNIPTGTEEYHAVVQLSRQNCQKKQKRMKTEVYGKTEDIGRQSIGRQSIGRQRKNTGNPADFLYRFCPPEDNALMRKNPICCTPGNEDEHMTFQAE